MKVTGSAVSLTVADPEASARFLEQTFGFEREMAADGFVSLTLPDVGFNVIYLRAGLPTFRLRDRAARTADGLLLVLVVDDIDRASIGLPPVDNVRDHVFTGQPWLATDPTLCPGRT